MKDVTAKVSSVELINHNVYEVKLETEETTFIAGQYLMIVLPTGEQVPYSIGSAPHTLPTLTLFILVSDPDSLAQKVIDHIRASDSITVKMPGGDSHLESGAFVEDVEHILLIAGGTGFSQMKSLYDSLIEQKFKGHVSLYWGLRTPKDIFMQEWIQQAQDSHTFSLDVVVNEADQEWQGRTGWLYEAVLEDHPDLSNSVAFISGSVGMVYGTLDQLETKGLQKERCFSDVFAYAPHPDKPEL
ncbi:NAD(P)H-flavin reductase [Marinomonas pollencensis]|uniref:CDP-4-dehydro-6-deoxyglucose reductase n=1 Tax=Marinomonas pollencensis TaxID=491954 RepID=A0A3E0DQN3_9GAMM|nr:NAD(P)H-flavin reductase [Marinomonas pollencensis]REG85133.1 CDP-4-dehydro-6-deoxyglucose reductase [Marinomonas pollencensis]